VFWNLYIKEEDRERKERVIFIEKKVYRNLLEEEIFFCKSLKKRRERNAFI
jgi:hypothetical protein